MVFFFFFAPDTLLSIAGERGELGDGKDVKQLMIKYGLTYPPHRTKFDNLHVSGIEENR